MFMLPICNHDKLNYSGELKHGTCTTLY